MKYAAMALGMEGDNGVPLTNLESLEVLANMFPNDVELFGGVGYVSSQMEDFLFVWDDDRVWNVKQLA